LKGDYEGWIIYYLKAVRDSALDAHLRAKGIEKLEGEMRALLQNDAKLAKQDTAHATLNVLFQMPVIGATELSQALGKAYNTASSLLQYFVSLGIISENKEQKRNKLYRFDPYLRLLEQEYL
jgi:Fic family protein